MLVVLLLVLNSNRRIRHRAEVAELQAQQTEAVRTAEREMQQETLAQVGRELHDNIGQLLTAIRIGTLRWKAPATTPNAPPAPNRWWTAPSPRSAA